MSSFFVLARGIHGMRKREEDAMNYGKGRFIINYLACEIFPSESTVFATFDIRPKVVEKKGVQVTDQS
jgi:hypothetical protein